LHDLKGAAKGLRDEFPMLAHVFRLATNPIAFVVAGIAGAWAIWKSRVDELTKSLSEVELPDTKAMDPGHVDAMTEAWGKWGDALASARDHMASVAEQAKKVFEAIDKALDRQKKLLASEKELTAAKGGDTSGFAAQERGLEFSARQAKIDTKMAEAGDLMWDAAKKENEASGIKAGTADDDKKTQEELKARAEVGMKEMAQAQQRMGDLRAYQGGEMSPWDRDVYSLQYLHRYGTMTPDEAMAAEQNKYNAGLSAVNLHRRFAESLPGRDYGWKRREELFGEAAKERGTAEGLAYEEAPFEQGQLDLDKGAAGRVALNEELAGAYKALKEGEREAQRLADAAARQVEHTGSAADSTLRALDVLSQTIDALNSRIAQMESRLANMRNH
jgi:hypothetical protein